MSERELKMARGLAEALSDDWQPEAFRDTYPLIRQSKPGRASARRPDSGGTIDELTSGSSRVARLRLAGFVRLRNFRRPGVVDVVAWGVEVESGVTRSIPRRFSSFGHVIGVAVLAGAVRLVRVLPVGDVSGGHVVDHGAS